MKTLGLPECVPVLTRDYARLTDSLPKYLVHSGDLEGCVELGDLRIKLIDLFVVEVSIVSLSVESP